MNTREAASHIWRAGEELLGAVGSLLPDPRRLLGDREIHLLPEEARTRIRRVQRELLLAAKTAVDSELERLEREEAGAMVRKVEIR
ncbi:MAG: hypothetical protein HY558_06940 [Euryarchaeota archaeon]|nr:hypothetical protein [Euryarchaeota archaeon]